MNSRLKVVWVLICLVVGISGCTIPELESAKRELDKAITELPTIQQVEVVKTLTYVWSDAKDDYPACYYARAYIIYGTQLSIEEVLELYTAPLQTLRWVVEEPQYENAKLFIRGEHERMDIGYLAQGTEIANEAGYEQLKSQYKTVFDIRIDYMLPKREQC